MSKKINIITLGCSKNTVDSEKLLRQFQFAGYDIMHDREDARAEITIVNTCGFINDAKQESIDTILHFIKAKERGDIGSLYVMGCLSERYIDELKAEIPEVDKYFGVNDIKSILRSVNSEFSKELYSERILTGPGHYAYLKISEGCDRSCSFCAIPSIRGTYISKPQTDLVHESRILAENGVKELILIAQDLSYYGLDLYGKQTLAELIEKLNEINGIEWIRLHYLYPANFPLQILDIMKANPKLCRYIDLPVQHISENVLKLMKRSHNEQETRDLLWKIRYILPDAAIRSTLITGHPGETETDFKKLMDFVKEFRFDRLGVFTYSHEEGTHAYSNYKNDIPNEVKKDRADSLMTLQQNISLEKNIEMKDKTLRVVIDRIEGDYYICRSEYDSPEVDQEILIPTGKKAFRAGDFVDVKITGANEYDLTGEVE